MMSHCQRSTTGRHQVDTELGCYMVEGQHLVDMSGGFEKYVSHKWTRNWEREEKRVPHVVEI